MSKESGKEYVKRTQRDYTLSFKLQVVTEIENGELSTHGACRKYGIQARSTVVMWLRKHGTFDWENQTPSNMPKSESQKLLELEQEVRLLKKQKAFLEKQVERSDKKAIIFDMMINIAEKEYNIPIRKTLYPNNQHLLRRRTKRHKLCL